MSTYETYSVVGYWVDSEERYVEFFDAATVRGAEEAMLAQARAEAGVFRIAGTMLGEHYRIDAKYTAFIDPDDPENDNHVDLETPVPGFEVEEWTVFGLILATDDEEWNKRTGGERYLGRHMALSPRIAEDLARGQVGARAHRKLVVCAVFDGVKNRCESYPFADHDQRAG